MTPGLTLVAQPSGLERQCFTAVEVSQILGISERSVYDWIARGDIKVVPNRGAKKLIPRREIDRLLRCEEAG